VCEARRTGEKNQLFEVQVSRHTLIGRFTANRTDNSDNAKTLATVATGCSRQ
jgi:hypothetical protein